MRDVLRAPRHKIRVPLLVVSERTSASVALVGPTASGKSALAHEFALEQGERRDRQRRRDERLSRHGPRHGEADAGGASEVTYHLHRPRRAERGVHGRRSSNARRATRRASSRGARRGVLYVGGTGLYGRAVLDDLDIPGRYPEVRARSTRAPTSDLDGLYDELVRARPAGRESDRTHRTHDAWCAPSK